MRVMTPRPKIVFLNLDDPEEANWRKIVTSGHSYFPVYQTQRDKIVGMVAVKALWAHSAIGLPTTLKNLLLPPLFVPETFSASQLLEQFKKTGKHIAVVTDEFGAVQGLVTLIDVLEAIEHVKTLFPIDDTRIVIRGFSMGGAGCWQFAGCRTQRRHSCSASRGDPASFKARAVSPSSSGFGFCMRLRACWPISTASVARPKATSIATRPALALMSQRPPVGFTSAYQSRAFW
jgi:hypothetical protein